MIIYKQGQQLPYKYGNLELNLTTSFYSFKYFTAAQILKEYPHMPGIQSENTLNTFWRSVFDEHTNSQALIHLHPIQPLTGVLINRKPIGPWFVWTWVFTPG